MCVSVPVPICILHVSIPSYAIWSIKGLCMCGHARASYIAADAKHVLKKRQAEPVGEPEGKALDAKVREHE